MNRLNFDGTFSAGLTLTALFVGQGLAQTSRPATQQGKQLLLPPRVWNVPKGNDYSSRDSEFCYARSAMSQNLAMFWSKEYGDDPAANPDPAKRFNTREALEECERFYNLYVDRLRFVERGRSVADRYKLLIYVVGGKDGTAYGGGEGQVGVLWTPAARMNRKPYGALAHEMGHVFQHFVHEDGAPGFAGQPGSQAMFEMTSQYMLWQAYPEWLTFENYHLQAFLKGTHYAFLHEYNTYHSPFVLEYWSGKHGQSFVSKLWREAKAGEDPVEAYKRLTSIDQAQFNNEMFDAARRFVTWDLGRVENVASQYANQHTSRLTAVGDGWYRIAEAVCPQNYGYNAVQLKIPSAGTTVTLDFEGLAGTAGYRSVKADKAGWRHGFLAVKEDGSRIYGPMSSASEGTTTFDVPDKTAHLWLVVSGAPTEHWQHLANRKASNDEQWPYRIRLNGATLDESVFR